MRVGRWEFEPYNWVVEVIGLELETHHPVIEPVSVSLRVSGDREHGFHRIVSNDFRGS